MEQTKKQINSNPRFLAARSLLSCESGGKYANIEVKNSLEAGALSPADKAFYTALVYGVLERLITLDYMIGKFSSRPLSSLDRQTRTALRLGFYQLAFMDKIPSHAAVSESVELAPEKARGFVNALLRSFLRADCRVEFPADRLKALSVKYSVPEDMCRFFLDRFGDETTESVFAAYLAKRPVAIRVNTLKITPEKLKAELADAGCPAEYSAIAEDVLLMERGAPAVAGLGKGAFFIQDEASRLAVLALDPQPGEIVVDTCSCPGGKSFSAAIDMQNRGEIHAFDIHGNKLSLVKRGAETLGISILTTEERDARNPDEALIGRADRVLCDAPCSGLGVIGKKPDIKYKNPAEFSALPEIQRAVLAGASAYVKAGGILVYSTCTINPDENGAVVKGFLSDHPDFEPVDFKEDGFSSREGMLTLLPGQSTADGFFIAKLMRKK